MQMTTVTRAGMVLTLVLGLSSACESDAVPTLVLPPPAVTSFKPALLVTLPDTCNTPDGMRMIPGSATSTYAGDVILACPNFANPDLPAQLMKLSADNKIEPWFAMPPHPETGKAGPMGLDFGPDGNLYVADHQYRYNKEFKSRLIRVKVSGGVATGFDVVATGFRLANAVMWRKNWVYVSDTWFDNISDTPGTSGIYHFSIDELNSGTPIALKAAPTDPHLVTTFHTLAGRGVSLAGADGITFDKDGNLYTGNFGDGVISKLALDDAGNMSKQEIMLINPNLVCVDGMFADTKAEKIYVADAAKNAIRVVNIPDGSVTKLWSNADSDGADGSLDQPAEVFVRGNELLIANFDLAPAGGAAGVVNTASDPVHTLSVIKLK